MELTMENIRKQEKRIRSFWARTDELYVEFHEYDAIHKEANETASDCLAKIKDHWYHKINPFILYKLFKNIGIYRDAHKDMLSTLALIEDYNELAKVEIAILQDMGKENK